MSGLTWGLGERPGTAVGQRLIRQDTLVIADAVVVLGGAAQNRAPHAATLWSEQLAPVVLAVGGIESDGLRSQADKTASWYRVSTNPPPSRRHAPLQTMPKTVDGSGSLSSPRPTTPDVQGRCLSRSCPVWGWRCSPLPLHRIRSIRPDGGTTNGSAVRCETSTSNSPCGGFLGTEQTIYHKRWNPLFQPVTSDTAHKSDMSTACAQLQTHVL